MAETAEAIRATVADHEVWSIRDEDEILARYVAAGVDVRSLEDVAAMVPLKVADEQAILRATPRGLFHQVRIRRRFHDRMGEEVAQLLYEALFALSHNAATYGYRAGAPEERPLVLSLLAIAVSCGPDDRERAQSDPLGQLSFGLARAMSRRRMVTGLRPIFGDFGSWYITQVAQWSYLSYRERHILSRIPTGSAGPR